MYLEYEELRWRYNDALKQCNKILEEKEVLFARTQPKSMRYDQEKVSGTPDAHIFDDYVITMEKRKVNERLAEARSILEERKNLLEHKEWELRQSQDIKDRLYVLRFLDRWRIRRISKFTQYSEAQIYRYLQEIRETIER